MHFIKPIIQAQAVKEVYWPINIKREKYDKYFEKCKILRIFLNFAIKNFKTPFFCLSKLSTYPSTGPKNASLTPKKSIN